MSLEFIDRYIIFSYTLFWFSYCFILWLIRKQFPLLYCSWNPITRLIMFFYYAMMYLMVVNGSLFESITVDSFLIILITHLLMNAVQVCLVILKHKQVLRAPRFEFRKLPSQNLESILTTVDRFMKESSSAIHKHDEFEIGYKNFYYYYELYKEPFLYMEYNQANQLAGVNLEFYPVKEFDLMKLQQLIKLLYQSYGKNILAPYSRSRSLYFIFAVVSLVIIMISGMVFNFNIILDSFNIGRNYIIMNCLFVIPLVFLFLDAFRKPDKTNFLDNQF